MMSEQLIKIKSVEKNGVNLYYITDENDKFLRKINNSNQMDWILSGDFNEYPFVGQILIEKDVVYNINDPNIVDSIIIYTDYYGKIKNLSQYHIKRIEYNAYTDDDYKLLSLHGKIVYLFETTNVLENMVGRYLKYNNNLYLFEEKKCLVDGINNCPELFGKNFTKGDDLLVHYFRRIGTIINTYGSDFSLTNLENFNNIKDDETEEKKCLASKQKARSKKYYNAHKDEINQRKETNMRR